VTTTICPPSLLQQGVRGDDPFFGVLGKHARVIRDVIVF
jgi:hypothetical protein